mmetsp:Transcript_37282/g.119562  ORF Transcript_37282/g.119562 Transcript_37282/m.119562 type:complete len:194 (-) Transcript_37282:136-717(-)
MQEMVERRIEQQHGCCFEVSRVLGHLPAGSLPRLAKLNLDGTLLTASSRGRPTGIRALSSALARGAMPQLATLRLCQAALHDGAVEQLARGLSVGGLERTLRVLQLDDNEIHELSPLSGCRLRHLSAARNPLDFDSLGRTLEAGAFPALRSLYFTAWHIPAGEEGSAEAAGRLALKAACEARGVTCHCALLED